MTAARSRMSFAGAPPKLRLSITAVPLLPLRNFWIGNDRCAIWLLLSLCSLIPLVLRGAETDSIVSIAQLRSLTPEDAARALPVHVAGVITRCTHDEIYLQEGADAIFVTPNRRRELYQLGDYVEFFGTTARGHFIPMVLETSSRFIEHRTLPTPIRATYRELASGRLDCCWVEVAGVIRSAERRSSGKLVCRLALDGALLQVEIANSPEDVPLPLTGATVRLQGVAGGLKNHQRQIVQPIVWVIPTEETFRLETQPPADLFALSSQAISTLLSFSPTAHPAAVSKVTGQVTWSESPTHLFIRDQSDSLEVRLHVPSSFEVGDLVDVAGFAEHGTMKPVLVDAFARRIGHTTLPAPRQTSVGRMLRHDDEADLVQIEAWVEDVVRTNQTIVFNLLEDGITFDVVYSRKDDHALPPLPERGSRVSFIGICKVDRMTSDSSQLATAAAFSLGLRTLDDVHVLSSPTWWSKRRLGLAFAALSIILVLAGGWIWILRRTVAQQTKVIVAQTRAEATLEERDRIARELHDSLEQRLAGTTILLDAAARAMIDQADAARSHLDTARAMLRHSLDEAQRAVLDLRSREFEGGDLVNGLEHSLQGLVAGHSVDFRFERGGERPRLDGVTENHLLRLAQEAVTNALKHAGATEIRVALSVDAAQLTLRVKDNGRGMELGREGARAQAGQFGLIGMRERADKLQARFTIVSAEGGGTSIEVILPRAPLKRRTSKRLPRV